MGRPGSSIGNLRALFAGCQDLQFFSWYSRLSSFLRFVTRLPSTAIIKKAMDEERVGPETGNREVINHISYGLGVRPLS